MWIEFPERTVPDFVILLVTTTPMYDGTPEAGGGLLPPPVDQLLPHMVGGLVVGSVIMFAKPLKAEGAAPPDSAFNCHQVSPHHVTVDEPAPAAVLSPSVNTPPVGKANTMALLLSLEAL
jgi:hypothetical protein